MKPKYTADYLTTCWEKYKDATEEEKKQLLIKEPQVYLNFHENKYDIVTSNPCMYLDCLSDYDQVRWLEAHKNEVPLNLSFSSPEAQELFLNRNKSHFSDYFCFADKEVQKRMIKKDSGLIHIVDPLSQEEFIINCLTNEITNYDVVRLLANDAGYAIKYMGEFNDKTQMAVCASKEDFFMYASPHVKSQLLSKHPEIYFKYITSPEQQKYCVDENHVECLKYAEDELQSALCIHNSERYLKHAAPKIQEGLCRSKPDVYFRHAAIDTQHKLYKEDSELYKKYVDLKAMKEHSVNKQIAILLTKAKYDRRKNSRRYTPFKWNEDTDPITPENLAKIKDTDLENEIGPVVRELDRDGQRKLCALDTKKYCNCSYPLATSWQMDMNKFNTLELRYAMPY